MSRETRLLLTAAALALAVLWLLARIRFQGLPDTPNPIPAVLSQFASTPPYDALAGQIAQIQSRLQPSLLLVDGPVAAARGVAVKLRDDLIVTRVPPGTAATERRDTTVLAHDPASGLAVASSMTANAMPLPLPWTPRRLQQPRYFLATRTSSAGVSLYPVFVGSLTPIDTPLWPAQVWAVPAGTQIVPGALLFTTDAELAGLVVADGGGAVVVPIALVLAEAERMLSVPPRSGGVVGIQVQALTPAVAAAAGAQRGVVVTAVSGEQGGDGVHVGDVVEGIDGLPVTTLQQWHVRVARMSPGDTLALSVRRGGDLRAVTLVAAAPANPPAIPQLGLGLRAVPRVGVEVVRVEAGSAADRAGLVVGDVITLVAGAAAPSPAQVQRAFEALDEGQRLLIAVTRGDAHMVTVLAR